MGVKIVDNLWNELDKYTVGKDFLLITDKNVYEIYEGNIRSIINSRENIHVIEPGEESKSLEELAKIYEILINNQISRKGRIICLGGGVVGDISGFAAATYKRGISYIQIPTTLLSQVDSSIGGKTGIDFLGLKNIIGAFHFPFKTLIYTPFLNTLSSREITSGVGEVIKYGLIYDYDFFKYVVKNIPEIYNRNESVLKFIIKKSIEIKTSVVAEDKYDMSNRQMLNFGHTIGHGIESLYNYEKYNHGEAVILGMLYESKIAFRIGLISKDYYDEIHLNLEPLVESVEFSNENITKLMEYMKNDKKNIDNKISFSLPIGKGRVKIFNDINESLIRDVLLSKLRGDNL